MSEEKKENEKSGNDNGQASPPRQGIPEDLMNMIGASPPKFVNFDQLMSAADSMKNMTLAHEIAINKDFEVPENESSSLEKSVRDTMHRAFWDVFQEKLNQDPPDMSMALSVIGELKEMINDVLLPQQQPMKEQIHQVLDLELIKQKMEHDAFDIDYYSNYVTDIMGKTCAPVRDENIAHIRTINEVVPKFKAILEALELMRKDMVNFTIKQMRPYIQQHAIDYERKKFGEFFETQTALGLDPLTYTRTWLQRNFNKLHQLATESQPVGASSSASNSANCIPTPANVMSEAYLEILEWADPHNFPETLMLDTTRLMSLRDNLQSLALMSSIQLVTFGVVGPAVEGVEALKGTMKEHVEILLNDVAKEGIKSVLQSIAYQMVKDVEESLSGRGLPVLSDDQKHGIMTQISGLGSRDNKVRGVMFQRLIGFIREGMCGKAVDNLRVPKGCTAIHKELSQVLGNFMRLTTHNRSVFGPYYAPIIEKLMKPEEDGDKQADSEMPRSCNDLPNGH